jgi:hypothetical protein
VQVCPPRADKRLGDRRSTSNFESSPNENSCHFAGEWLPEEGEENQGEAEESWHDSDYSPDIVAQGEDGDNEPGLGGADASLEEDVWEDICMELHDDLLELDREEHLSVLYCRVLGPSSYYWAGGWFSTGMENVRHCSRLTA